MKYRHHMVLRKRIAACDMIMNEIKTFMNNIMRYLNVVRSTPYPVEVQTPYGITEEGLQHVTWPS